MSSAFRAERHTVLLVEDEPALRASMVRGLSKLDGTEVQSVGNVRDACRSIVTRPPDMVITDLDLPDGSGIEVIGELDRVGLRVPIVFVSAFIGKYRARLPQRAGIDVFEKPIALERLRRVVQERLTDDDVPSSPFGVSDYVQLAGMGRRSVVIEVRGRLAGRGSIVIRNGDIWAASDERGSGEEAFRRLAFLSDAVVTCKPLDGATDVERTIEGSCLGILLDAARHVDECEHAKVDDAWGETPARAFDAIYEEGVDALLAKRFEDAYRAFVEAERVLPGDSRVHANIERLRQMGCGA